jgi:hypothetical protein
VSPAGPTEERVIWNERFQGEQFDFRGKVIFTRFDSCEFVKCTLLIDHDTGQLARISHSVEAHRGANQRKLLCSNDFSLIQGAPRCRQIVAQNALILEWWTVGLWKRPLMAGW